MLVFDKEGHIAIAKSFMENYFYLLLNNSVDANWQDNIPNYEGEVLDTFGVVPEFEKSFVLEDEDGDIDFFNQKYSTTDTATNQILISFKLKGVDLYKNIIRQHLVITGAVVNEDAKSKRYLTLDEVDISSVHKILAENIIPSTLQRGSSEIINYIIRF